MRSFLIWLASMLTITGCVFLATTIVVEFNKEKNEKELQYHIRSFEKIFEVRVNYPVSLGDPGPIADSDTAIGVCSIGLGSGMRKVVLSEMWWNFVGDESSKEHLVFHELAHCSKFLDHDDSSFYDYEDKISCPASIMASSDITGNGDYCYEKHRDLYIEALKYNKVIRSKK